MHCLHDHLVVRNEALYMITIFHSLMSRLNAHAVPFSCLPQNDGATKMIIHYTPCRKMKNTHVKIQLRKVNLACFPVSYNDAFYRSVVTLKDEDLCKFAYWNGFVVGAVCTRVEPHPDRYVLLLFVCIHIFKSVICVLFYFSTTCYSLDQ